MASYRNRLPEDALLRVETIHAGLCIYREEEDLFMHCPPSTSRQYDAILLDECSQLDNGVASKLIYPLEELPHQLFVGVAADYISCNLLVKAVLWSDGAGVLKRRLL